MATGTDHVVLAAAPPATAIPAFLDDWSQTWPGLLVDAHGEGFAPWMQVRFIPLSDHGEILVARDRAVDLAWDEHSYDLPCQDEGRTVGVQATLSPAWRPGSGSSAVGDGRFILRAAACNRRGKLGRSRAVEGGDDRERAVVRGDRSG
jgi:hypothetical protein